MNTSSFANNPYLHLKYKRGYVISDRPINPPHDSWEVFNNHNYFIYYDSSNEVHYKNDKENWVFVLGKMVDSRYKSANLSTIATKLLEYLNTSVNEFYSYLDEIAGRYFVLFGNKHNSQILSDATGLRSIFYSKDKTIIASHCELVQEYVNAPKAKEVQTEWLTTYTSYGLPGHFTPYQNIFFLTPNTLLQINEKKVKRFFPRENLQTVSVKDAALEISTLVKEQLELLLSKGNKFLLSLSGGLDSRTSLALTKEYKDYFKYFTYSIINQKSESADILNIDKQIVTELSSNLGLDHDFIEIDYGMNDEDFKNFSDVMYKNTFIPNNFRLVKLYYKYYSEEYLHIRSNLFEIGRLFFKKHIQLPKDINIESMVKCYSQKALKDEKVYNAFSNYFEVVEMSKLFNYDPYDIYYWEYRMGTWHSLVLLESDIAHDTYIFFNSRKILNLLLSVAKFERSEGAIFQQIIKDNWPVLNFWKINSLETLSDYYDKQIDEYGLILNNITFSGGSIVHDGRNVPVQSLTQSRSAKFFIETSNPKRGDYALAKIPLVTEVDQGYYGILEIRSPYEMRNLRGRLKYQIIMNNKILLEEDICDWKETSQIHLKWRSKLKRNDLVIRVLAIRDCEDWSWGKAGTILIERIVLRKDDEAHDTEITSTSPYSNIL
jgi:hypothetical protein